jgi:glycosyltransferase involved in cell wall biosynthesis
MDLLISMPSARPESDSRAVVETPKVSIVLTTRNRAAHLRESLATILEQSFPDFELIVCDDASTDDTAEVIACQRDRRIRYLRTPEPLGMPGNLNRGVECASGAYLLVLHDHDLYEPDLVKRMVEVLDVNPTAMYVHPGLFEIDKDGQFVRSHVDSWPAIMNGRAMATIILSRWDCPVCALTMMRRRDLAAIGNFDERYGFISDVAVWVRLAMLGEVAYLAEPLIGVRPRESSHQFAGANWRMTKLLCMVHADGIALLYERSAFWRRAIARVWFEWRRQQLLLLTMVRGLARGEGEAFETQGLAEFAQDRSLLIRCFGRLLDRRPLRAAVRRSAAVALSVVKGSGR